MIRYRGIMIDRERRLIAHGGAVMTFPRVRYRLVEALICAGPKTRRELFHLVYGDRADGGPTSGVNIIEVSICQLMPLVEHLGLTIVRSRMGRTQWIEPMAILERRAA